MPVKKKDARVKKFLGTLKYNTIPIKAKEPSPIKIDLEHIKTLFKDPEYMRLHEEDLKLLSQLLANKNIVENRQEAVKQQEVKQQEIKSDESWPEFRGRLKKEGQSKDEISRLWKEKKGNGRPKKINKKMIDSVLKNMQKKK